MAANTYSVAINANGQLFNVNVFANNTVEAIENAKNQVMGRLGSRPRFTIVSVTPFNSCAPTTTVINTNTNRGTVSRFVATGGSQMDVQ